MAPVHVRNVYAGDWRAAQDSYLSRNKRRLARNSVPLQALRTVLAQVI
jgi:hypothetical protein